MTTETQKRIRAYKRALPELRERVIAVALLLAMSASMLTSASFAWITLSRAPEVTGMQTTVAANGNLEIALAQGSMRDETGMIVAADNPLESAVGDSSAAEGQTIVGSNVKWGNLVNLSDPAYGLNSIALRPALMSGYNRTEYPLYGATYGNDGRVIATDEQYEYTSWAYDASNKGFFNAENVQYGVRAISSIQYTNRSGNATVETMWAAVNKAYDDTQTAYYNIVEGRVTVDSAGKVTCMDTISGMLETFAQEKADKMLHSAGDADYSGHVTYFYNTMEKFKYVLDLEGQALVKLANLQAYLDNSDRGTSTFESIDDLLSKVSGLSDSAMDAKLLADYGVKLTSLHTFRENYTTLTSDLNNANLKKWAEECNPDVYTTMPYQITWSQISGFVNHFVNINTAELSQGSDKVVIGSLTVEKDAMTLLDIVNNNSESNLATATIKGGILKDTEQRTGARSVNSNIVVKIWLDVEYLFFNIHKYVYAYVQTDAVPPFTADEDKQYTTQMEGGAGSKGEDPEAKDTYGMAIDVWVRTNAPSAVLTLEGQTLYTEVEEYGVDKNGNNTLLYVLSLEEGGEADVYLLDGTYYYLSDHQPVDETLLPEDELPIKTRKEISGYQGENRVWEDWESMIERGQIQEDNTTQGAGSCFVFYANPSEKENILELLQSFNVTFLNSEGKTLGSAVLNINNAYAINGKVTVPLEILDGVTFNKELESGKIVEEKGITTLVQNQPQQITAVIYLDGLRLKNENVLSSGVIEGQLNLQFGSSAELTSAENKELQAQFRTITAKATYGAQSSEDEENPITLDYDGNAKKIHVSLTVDGEQPKTVAGFFVRSINATQGTREESVAFKKNVVENEDGTSTITWDADFNLTRPGHYLMRSVVVDGMEYDLIHTVEVDGEKQAVLNYPTVDIEGLTITRMTTSLKSGSHMTADNGMDVTVTARIAATPELMPKQVRAIFRGVGESAGTEYTALMTLDNTDANNPEWVGTTRITSSGTYRLEYLVMDGEYNDVPEQYRTTLVVSLGMTCQIWPVLSESLPSTSFTYENGVVTIPMQVRIYDDGEKMIENLATGEGETMTLYYHSAGSSMDENGLFGPLTWDENTKYYCGDFKVNKLGRFSFDRIAISGDDSGSSISTIRNTLNAPVIAALPPAPPMFISDNDADDYQVSFDGSATMKVALRYADAAVIGALIENQEANRDGTKFSQVVRGTRLDNETVTYTDEKGKEVTVNYYSFPIPVPTDGTQDGNWLLKELYFQGIQADTDGDGQPNNWDVTEEVKAGAAPQKDENSYVVTLTGDQIVDAYVVSTVSAAWSRNGAAYEGEALGLDATGKATAEFMSEQTVNPVTLTVLDRNGREVSGVASATWTLSYSKIANEGMKAYGGYKPVEKYDPDAPIVNVAWTDGEDPELMSESFTLATAGKYYSTVQIFFADGESQELAGPAITVSSKVPKVTVTGVTPTGTYSSDTTSPVTDTQAIQTGKTETGKDCDGNPEYEYTYRWTTNSAHKTGFSSTISEDELTATVYFKCWHPDGSYEVTSDSSTPDNANYHYYYVQLDSGQYYGHPTVTLTLNGVQGFTSATLKFDDNTHIYNVAPQYATNGSYGYWETTGGNAYYTWTAEGQGVTRYIGYSWNQKNRITEIVNAAGQKTPAGTIKANELEVVYGGVTYVFTIETVTINNPH